MSFIDEILNQSASPEEGRHLFDEFKAKTTLDLDNNIANQRFLKLFGNTTFLSRFVIKNPEIYKNYIESKFQISEKPIEIYKAEIEQLNPKQLLDQLKNYKYQEYVRLTIRELLGENCEATYREFACLAEAALQCVVKKCETDLLTQMNLAESGLCDYAIIGMGKLGGKELNYSSDIDLIGFYDEDGSFGHTTYHEFFVKLFAEVGKAMSTLNEHGFLFRVDWDLRPEGRSGTLANSFISMENYYVTFGEEWERQAYIKARILFQRENLGDQFLKLMRSFVYRKTFDEKTIHNTWNMKAKILNELHQRPQKGVNIKLDRGGIRDIEFFCQGFQLLYGGRHKNLQCQNTLTTLENLAENNLVPSSKAQILRDCYLFLRRLESCLQMEKEQQTHVLKDNEDFQIKVARRMGISISDKECRATLLEEFSKVREAVTQIFEEYYKQSS